MDSPLALSAVVPTHDTRELTLRCLGALAAADPPPFEVIVVDDGSGDGTAEAVAASYPAVRLLRHETARGFTAAANAGLAAARAEGLLLLNSDTEVAVASIGALGEALATRPRLGIAGASLVYPDGTPQWSGGRAPDGPWLFALASGLPRRLAALGGAGRSWRRLRPVSGHAANGRGPEELLRVAWVTGAAMAIRRVAWEAAAPLDERFALYCQDVDLCLRVARLGWEVAVVPGAVVVHHHGATISGVVEVGPGRHHAAMLWADLVRLAFRHGGPRGARRASRALRLGGWLQRQLLLAGALGADREGEAKRERRALSAAAAVLRELDPAASGSPPRSQ